MEITHELTQKVITNWLDERKLALVIRDEYRAQNKEYYDKLLELGSRTVADDFFDIGMEVISAIRVSKSPEQFLEKLARLS